jgi:hypothetical protein
MNIYRKHPKKITHLDSLKEISKYLAEPDEVASKMAAIWIIGDFAE